MTANFDLSKYPRPTKANGIGDNGLGLDFRLNVLETDKKPYVTQCVQLMQSVHMSWSLIAVQDFLQMRRAANACWAVGIMPVGRLVWPINKPYPDVVGYLQQLHADGIPGYIQLFNEPSNPREWRPGKDGKLHIKIAQFGATWADLAIAVYDAGGYPGINALDQDEWLAAYNSVAAKGRLDIFDRAWWSLHNYGGNHPIDYPLDDVNQNGTPVTPEEYARYQWQLTFDEVNALRHQTAWEGLPNPKNKNEQPHHGQTVMDDDTCAGRYVEYIDWMKQSLGYSLPLIGGEGIWPRGCDDDKRYPKLSDALHADLIRRACLWFQTGRGAFGEPLPPELFSVCFWGSLDFGPESWWYGILGTDQATIDAVASIPLFVRGAPGNPPPPPQPAPVVDFAAHPETVNLGGSSTLRWDVTNAIRVLLNGNPVLPSGEQTITPAVTAEYLLEVIGQDGSDEEYAARVTVYVNPPPPPTGVVPPVHFDIRPHGAEVNDWPNWVSIHPTPGSPLQAGQLMYVDEVVLLVDQPPDNPASEGSINANVFVVDYKDDELNNVMVTQSWPDGAATKYTGAESAPGAIAFEEYGSARPGANQPGPYVYDVVDASVGGLGLLNAHHVVWLLRFKELKGPA